MKTWMAIALMMFAAVGHVGKSEASFLDGTELLELCESESLTELSFCNGYLIGLDDAVNTYDGYGEMSKSFCAPKNAGTPQLRKVAIKGLNDNPERLHFRRPA